MKASLKFREEKSPLLRAKLPFKVGAIPLSSGVAIGSNEELAVQLGTFFSSGPAIKVAFRPNDASPVSIVLKMGFGAWGSPHGAPMTMKAEFYVSPKGNDPLFTLSLKPRWGDFSVQRDFDKLRLSHMQNSISDTEMVPAHSDISNDKVPMSTPPFSGGGRWVPRRISGNFAEKDRSRSPAHDSVVIGSNFSLKIEGLEKEWKGKTEKKQKGEGMKELDSEDDATPNGNGTLIHVKNDFLNDQEKPSGGGNQRSAFLYSRIRNQLRGCKLLTHSIVPLGTQNRLSIRWGAKSPEDIFYHWNGSLPTLCLSKLPSLVLDKISFESVSLTADKQSLSLRNGHLDSGILPLSFIEENQELAQVANLCFNMKQQLNLLYAENQVLRRSMEDMRAQVDLRGHRSFGRMSDDGAFTKEQVLSRPTSHSDGSWNLYDRSIEDNRNHKDILKKNADADVQVSLPSVGAGGDASIELEKTIRSAKNGSLRQKREK